MKLLPRLVCHPHRLRHWNPSSQSEKRRSMNIISQRSVRFLHSGSQKDQESNHVVCFSPLVCKYVCINNVCHVCGGLPLSPSRSFSQVLSLSLLVAPTAISELLYTAFATWDPVAQKERFRVGKWAGAITTPFGSFSARILGQRRGSARSQGWWMPGGATAAGRLLCFGEKLESYPPKKDENRGWKWCRMCFFRC